MRAARSAATTGRCARSSRRRGSTTRAEWATVRTSARRRDELVRDYAQARRDAIRIHAAGPMRAVVFERDAQGRADSLAREAAGQRDRRAAAGRPTPTCANATPFGEQRRRRHQGAGRRVRRGPAQPQGHLAKALLEPDAELDSAFLKFELELRRTGQRNRFYDITAWSLPLAWRVEAWQHAQPVPAGLAPRGPAVRWSRRPRARAQYGYAFAPGSEASIRLLASLLKDSVQVWHAPNPFTAGGKRFPNGAFVVRVAFNRPVVHRHRGGAALRKPVPPSRRSRRPAWTRAPTWAATRCVPIRTPRVALLGGAPVSGNSVGVQLVRDGPAHRLSDHAGRRQLRGRRRPRGLQRADHAVHAGGGSRSRCSATAAARASAEWVRNGGVLITIDAAPARGLAQERVGSRGSRVRRDSTRADSAPAAPRCPRRCRACWPAPRSTPSHRCSPAWRSWRSRCSSTPTGCSRCRRTSRRARP